MRLPYFLMLLLAAALVACGGGGGDQAAVPARIEIAPSAVLLTTPGQTKALQARVFDADGERLDVAVQWSSTDPDQVPVDAQGVLTAAGVGGSSQIVARIGELKSAPLLAVHTTVPAGAVLLSDAQIVGEPEVTDPAAPPSPANTYLVRLVGVPAPQAGTLLLNTESKIVGGRVQSVQTVGGEHVVTLALVPAREMFPRLKLSEIIDLSKAEVVFPADLQNSYTIRRQGDTFTFDPIPGRVNLAGSSAQRAAALSARVQPQTVSVEFKKGPFSCKPALDGAAGAGSEVIALTAAPSFSVTLLPSLDVLYTEANGLERFVLRAQPGFTADAGLKALVAMEGKVTCEVELLSIRIPVGGPVALIIGGQLPVGVGVELGGKLTVANIGVSAKSSVSTALNLGLNCPAGNNCAVVAETEPLKTAFTPSVEAPMVEDLRLEPSLSVYGFVKAAIGNPFLRALRFDAFKAKVGLAMKGNFAPQSAQIFDTAYRSDYKLVGEIKAGADTNFIDLAAFLGLNNVAENALELSIDIASTPVGSVTADKATAVLGETVEFTVKLDPTKIDFLPLVGPYNVKRVLLVRNVSTLPLLGATAREVASVDALPGQTEFKLRFAPTSAAENGPTDQFYAFMVTTLLPTDLFALELGQVQVQVPGRTQGTRISVGYLHVCALTAAEGVQCWGSNQAGKLGIGSLTNLANGSADVAGLASGVASVSAGDEHTCALTQAGAVKCWGHNLDGDGNTSVATFSRVPVDVVGLGGRMLAVSSGGSHSCALSAAGAVLCWGSNESGQLGDGSTTNRKVPAGVVGLDGGVVAISASGGSTCALTAGGAVKCWGVNDNGQLGDGTTTNRSVPVNVTGLGSGVVAVSAGGNNTCALTQGGGVKCWGENTLGQLGNGQQSDGNSGLISTVPVDVTGLGSGVAAVSAGGVPRLRAHNGWRRQMLGGQRQWRAGEWNINQQPCAGECDRSG